ncbi:sulfotransferase family protein [Histidinibacterium aquaticum]|uniref:Sulfotransferase domain-containing protein n=1 Tax=Histidinibacterium aquaticum TaxID=2613962 RepID=A0A5J5GJX7_9RHOB|nr:sulfotransferase domain-containing protein [Histidinibacterium aquaticum]KAA9007834.1 sulfotransferase domain-containing protein [Histidinibacterium aquaticum]
MRTRPFPDFVIPGAMKSGTTSLARLLAALPDVTFARPKEPTLMMGAGYAAQNPAHVFPPPERLEETYARAFGRAGDDTLWGEASTAYFSDAQSPRMLAARNPEVKAVVLLRAPAARVRSAYHFSRGTLRESAPTLEAALEDEMAGGRDGYWPTLRHLDYSRYSRHLARWQAQLRPGHLHLLEFERFTREPLAALREVCAFLGVPEPDALPCAPSANATVAEVDGWRGAAMRGLYGRSPVKRVLKPLLPVGLRKGLKTGVQDMVARGAPPVPPPGPRARAILEAELSGVAAELEGGFGFRPMHWGAA